MHHTAPQLVLRKLRLVLDQYLGVSVFLEGRSAVIYGGGGIIGRAVARSFAREGASVFLVGRTADPLERVVNTIAAEGGRAAATTADATDQDAVEHHLDDVVECHGSVDIVFNAMTYCDVQGTALLDLPPEVMVEALSTAVRAQTITTRAAARHMTGRGSGVVLTVVGHGPPFPGMGTTAVTWQTVEALNRQWAVELGPHGVRVAWLRIGGTVDGITDGPDYGSSYAGDTDATRILADLEAGTMLGHLPAAAEIGDAAAFLAGDQGRSVTAGALNLTAGAVSD